MNERRQTTPSPIMRGPGPLRGGPFAGPPLEKAKDFRGTLKRLIIYLGSERSRLILVFFLAIASTLFMVLGPKIMGKATTKLGEGVLARYSYFIRLETAIRHNMSETVINKLRKQPIPLFDLNYIGKILLLMISLYVISALFGFFMAYIMASVAQNTVYRMRNDVKHKLDQLPLKYFDQRSYGDILSRVTNDMDLIATTLQQSLTQVITAFVMLIGILIMMLSISLTMTLIALITLPASMVITAMIAKKSQTYFSQQQKCIGELNGHVEEMISGHKIIKAYGREEDSVSKFMEINERLFHVGWKAQFVSGIIFPALNLINNIGYVLICVFGGLMVAKRKIEIGDIQAFIQYIRQFTQPLIQLANIASIFQSTLAAAERIFEVLDEIEESPDREDAQIIRSPKGEVHFEHVKFGYKEDAILMKDINIDVKSDHVIAVVGPTGAGKTTLVNLLMRFYEIQGGRITVDGVDIRDMKRGYLRRMCGMVLQDTWLFNGTIWDNIAYGREDASKEEIIRAAEAAHAHHFIMTLPDGYQTVLNEEASNISQGQKQLLTIARAILADPMILILDEATSNVDTRTEVLIQNAMARLMEGRTSFVIAHRLSTIRDAELILVMDHGAIIEQGTHGELLAKNGFYADLYNSQFTGRNHVS